MIDYSCRCCGAVDCKLWRPASTSRVTLICLDCLEANGHRIDLDETDQVYDRDIEQSSYVPAIPTLCDNWWGYTSVPSWWVAWWKGLPDKKHYCTLCRGSRCLEEFSCPKCSGTGMRVEQC